VQHEAKDGKFVGLSFPSFIALDSPPSWATNFYTQIFGGCHDRPCTRVHLERAKRRLAAFSAVLLADDPAAFQLTSFLLRQRLGWTVTDVSGRRDRILGQMAVDDAH
jgi:hypothetical protein